MSKPREHKRPSSSIPSVSADVLITESASEFAEFKAGVTRAINSQGPIASMYVDDLVCASWDIRRYRRAKTALLNSMYRPALVNLYNQITRPPENVCSEGEAVGDGRNPPDGLIEKFVDLGEVEFAEQWFTNPTVRSHFRELLTRYGLDEGYIEAEAIRLLSSDLDNVDRMLASLELRRDRILRSIKDLQTLTNEEPVSGSKLLSFNGRNLNGPRAQ